MGTTHRVYGLKEKNIPLSQLFNDIKLINDSLCMGDKKSFYYRFILKTPELIDKLNSMFEINFHHFNSTFYLSDYDKLLNLFEIAPSAQRFSFSNKLEKSERVNYLYYSLEIEQSKLSATVVPSITEDFLQMKKELIEIFETIKTQRLINLRNDELVTLVDNLIDTNLIPNATFSYKSNGVTFSASANFVPKGSNQIRPSGIKLKFDEDYIRLNGGVANASKQLYEGLNNVFDKSKYKIKGSFSFVYDTEMYNILSKMDFLDFNIYAFIDLNRNLNFTADYLELTSINGGHISLNNFDWKNSESNYLDNRIYLELNNSNEYELQIAVSKQINEEYYFNIELLIDKELEYLGME